MNGRERLLKTLRGEPTDRVPVSPFLYYNSVYEMFGYKPDLETFFDPPDFDPISKFVEYCDYFGFDPMLTLGSVWDFYSANTLKDMSVVRAWEDWDVTIAEERKGDEKLRTVTIRTPAGQLRHVEKYSRTSPYLIVSAPKEYFIKTPADFDLICRYAPPADFMDTRLVTRARQAVGDRGIVDTCTHGAFNVTAQFRKLEDLFMDPVTDEGFYRAMIEFFTENQIKRNRKLISAGVDVIEAAANLAGSGVGPKFYTKYIAEYENRILKDIHAAGVLNVFHNCGDAQKIMHLYNDLEIDCWGYLTPPPYGDVNLDDALRIMRPDMALRGNIDQVEFLRNASPQEIKTQVRLLLEKVKPRGNWILSTTDFLFDDTPYENIKAFADAGLEYGRY